MEKSLGNDIIKDQRTQFGVGVASTGVVGKSAFVAKIIAGSKAAVVGTKVGILLNPHLWIPVGLGIVGFFSVKHIINHIRSNK